SELEEAGYKVDDTKKKPGMFNPTLAPAKITICVFQTYQKLLVCMQENRYIEEKVDDGVAVNMFLKSQTQSSILYPAASEKCYKRLIELFKQEGLTVQKD
ncbi:MAG: hypothetical protein J6U77_08155, partial [Verrucomicrobia bacterium]|nr:hypothetical protein [Verrucomicrobiota bacterium]